MVNINTNYYAYDKTGNGDWEYRSDPIFNALELTWKIPYAIPNVNTQAVLSLKDSSAMVMIITSSIVTKVGQGNCYKE